MTPAEPTPTRLDAEAYAADEQATHRMTASPVRLVLDAIGGPTAIGGKLSRMVRTARIVTTRGEIARRLDRLEARGVIDVRPEPVQLVVLGLDMLRYFISPGAADYYATRGVHFGFHQLLRVLDDPVSMMDPVGICSDRDTIIGHVLQVTHANPRYDLQLLEMFEDGLAEMQSQTAAMVDGTHPRARTIGAIIEDADYHRRLLVYVRQYRADPSTPELRRRAGEARVDRHFCYAEETFGAMTRAFRYASRLPTTVSGAVQHLRTQPVIDPARCDPDVVAAVDAWFDEA